MKASRNATAGMTVAAHGRSRVEAAVRGVIGVARVRAVGLADRAMNSVGREDLIKIAAVPEGRAAADSAGRSRVGDARRKGVTIIGIAVRVRPSRRGRSW